MSRCCSEPGCRRSQPIFLYLGDLTGQVYAATRSELRTADGDTAYMRATARHDVTRQMREFIRRNSSWVREVLAEADPALPPQMTLAGLVEQIRFTVWGSQVPDANVGMAVRELLREYDRQNDGPPRYGEPVDEESTP
jgi:hypothetical protein